MSTPISLEEIRKTEAKTGVLFPPGFKARMARDNGGEIDVIGESWWLIPFLTHQIGKGFPGRVTTSHANQGKHGSGAAFHGVHSSLRTTEEGTS